MGTQPSTLCSVTVPESKVCPMEEIIGLALLYEIVEPSIIRFMREELKTEVWGYESPKNIITDILVAPLGAYLADKHSET